MNVRRSNQLCHETATPAGNRLHARSRGTSRRECLLSDGHSHPVHLVETARSARPFGRDGPDARATIAAAGASDFGHFDGVVATGDIQRQGVGDDAAVGRQRQVRIVILLGEVCQARPFQPAAYGAVEQSRGLAIRQMAWGL